MTFESRLTVGFSWTNHNSFLCIATNEIAAFCIDNRLCQMAFFMFAKVGKAIDKGRISGNKKALSVIVCFVII